MAQAEAQLPAQPQGQCWCCGQSHDEAELTRLGNHPEVAVCERCARWLHRRAQAPTDAGSGSWQARTRRAMGWARSGVMRLRLHQRPVIGSLLRRLDRHLP
jgi:hypothetical protein